MEIISILAFVLLVLGIASYFSFYYKSRLLGAMVYKVKTNEKVIALTFDDGPNGKFTEEILNLLDEYNAKATFFMVGKNIIKYPEIVKRVFAENNDIGIHSYSHAFHKYFTDPNFTEEITKTKNVLNNLGIHNIKYFRFPWLYRNPILIKNINRLGYKIISGQFAHGLEPFQVNHKRIFRHSKKVVHPGAIIIFHDGYNAKSADRYETVKALKLLLSYLKEKGYRAVTISELLNS